MFVRSVEQDTSLLKVREVLLHSRKKLDSHPAGKSYVPIFDALLTQWWDVFKTATELSDEHALARALLEFADVLLDDSVDSFDDATEDLPDLRRLLFEGASASTLKRPIAGNQLKKLQQWVLRLQGGALPDEVKALVPPLVEAVKLAEEATRLEESSLEKQKVFQLTGLRKQFIDNINQVRNDTFVGLSKQFEAETPGYRASLARRFLVKAQDAAGYRSSEEELSDVRARLDDARQSTALLEARYQELVIKREQQEQAEQEEQAKESRLAALRQETAALEADLARAKKRKKK